MPWAQVSQQQFKVVAVAVGAAVFVAVVVVSLLVVDAALWEQLGYPSVFVASLLGTASIFVPLPSILAVCGAGALHLPLAVGLLAGTGETLGDLSACALGYGGGAFARRHMWYSLARRTMLKHGALALFFVSVVPNPFFDLVGIVAGGVRYPVYRFLLCDISLRLLIIAPGHAASSSCARESTPPHEPERRRPRDPNQPGGRAQAHLLQEGV